METNEAGSIILQAAIREGEQHIEIKEFVKLLEPLLDKPDGPRGGPMGPRTVPPPTRLGEARDRIRGEQRKKRLRNQ